MTGQGVFPPEIKAGHHRKVMPGLDVSAESSRKISDGGLAGTESEVANSSPAALRIWP